MKQSTEVNAHRLFGPQLVALVSTLDESGRANAAPLAWVMTSSASPPMIALAVAPQRYTHYNIKTREEFVVNLPTLGILDELWFCGTNTGEEVDKFDATGLTTGPSEVVEVPRVEECVTHLECRLNDSMETGDHTVFVGEVVHAVAEDAVIANGHLDLSVIKPLLHVGGRRFATTEGETIEV